MSYETNFVISGIAGLFVGIGLFSLIGIGSCILLALSVYNDALYRRVENPTMWAVLSGFFNIVVLVYIIIQATKKAAPLRCMQCGDFLHPNSRFCQRCGRPLMIPSPDELNNYDRRRKLFLWLWIGSSVLSFIVLFVFIFIYVVRFIGAV